MSNKNIIISSVTLNGVLLLVTTILLLKKPEIQQVPVMDEILIKKVERLEKENLNLLSDIKDLSDSIDVIKKQQYSIKYIYREKIKFVKSANSDQLDSLIRSNW